MKVNRTDVRFIHIGCGAMRRHAARNAMHRIRCKKTLTL